MTGRRQSVASIAYYMLGLIGITLFVQAQVTDFDWLSRSIMSVPFWLWLMVLSIRLFGKRAAAKAELSVDHAARVEREDRR